MEVLTPSFGPGKPSRIGFELLASLNVLNSALSNQAVSALRRHEDAFLPRECTPASKMADLADSEDSRHR